MKTNCPTCGCTNSLDALLAFSEASEAFAAAIKLHGKLGTPLIKYLGLFRSPNRALKFEKVLNLLNQITPDIHAKQIKFDRHTYPAPESAWVWAISIMLERRDRGDLNTPLQNHNYLYKVISSYKPDQHVAPATTTHQHNAKSAEELAEEQAEHERLKQTKPAVGFAEMMAFTQLNAKQPNRGLKDIPQEQLMAFVSAKKELNETLEQCYQRLKAIEMEENTNG
ncbi:DUF2752 domain-containing protein [Acinetobacter puyangensis]|uniref:DUF2752 domain-containing protein n=1 Tax=Acinetobacter puyangensis TaxID=1096779 RepID=UPI003A4DBFCB